MKYTNKFLEAFLKDYYQYEDVDVVTSYFGSNKLMIRFYYLSEGSYQSVPDTGYPEELLTKFFQTNYKGSLLEVFDMSVYRKY